MIETFINHKAAVKVMEFIPIIRMLINWKTYIVNSFMTVDNRRISNGPLEGFNSNFKKMMTVANGYKNFERFRKRVLLVLGKRKDPLT